MDTITNSRLACFRACPRRHQLRYEIGLAPEESSLALRVGSAFHAGKEALDLGKDPGEAIAMAGDLDPYDLALTAAMVQVHTEHYGDDVLEVVASELSFSLPMGGDMLSGVIDRIYRHNGRLVIADYKTTTESIAPDSSFWTRLRLDHQMSIYTIAAREMGYDIDTIFYDATVRPLHRPQMATPPDKVKLKKNGQPYANTRLVDETPLEFCGRVADAMRADPVRYFARHEIAKLDDELVQVLCEVHQQRDCIQWMRDRGMWYRNPSACVTPYTCPYLGVCEDHQESDPAPAGYVLLDDVHPELTRAQTPPQQG